MCAWQQTEQSMFSTRKGICLRQMRDTDNAGGVWGEASSQAPPLLPSEHSQPASMEAGSWGHVWEQNQLVWAGVGNIGLLNHW